jgi:hypothetical protein
MYPYLAELTTELVLEPGDDHCSEFDEYLATTSSGRQTGL